MAPPKPMTHPLCLAHLSLIELAPADMVSTAAVAGFDRVSLRLAPAAAEELQHPVIGDTPMMCETLARLHALDVAVHDVELVGLRGDSDAPRLMVAERGASMVLADAGDA